MTPAGFAFVKVNYITLRQVKGLSSFAGPLTYPNSVTRPLEEAVMEPSSSMVYSAEMLSCRKRPSGSFFCSAYHFPAYCDEKEDRNDFLRTFFNTFALHAGIQVTHPLGVKVLFDCEAVNDTGGRQTALYAGQQDQQQGQFRGCHSVMNIHISVLGPETGCGVTVFVIGC